MRVLQIGPYPPPYGGVQVNILSIRRFLLERGIDCSVINVTRHRNASEPGVYHPTSALEVARLLWQLDYDIIHLHIGGNLTSRLVGLCFYCTMLPSCKTVLTFHSGGYPSSPVGEKANPWTLKGYVFRRLDRIIAVNEKIREMFIKFGVPQEKVRLISPFDPCAAVSNAELPCQIRGFLDSHSPILVTVGLLEPEYNLHLQIDSLELVLKKFPQAGLIIIGSGSLEQSLRDHISTKEYSDHVLLCGDVVHEATLKTISEADVFLRTTQYDGDSISVREALHLGVPVIATDNGMRPLGVHLTSLTELTPKRLAEQIEFVLSDLSRNPKMSPDRTYQEAPSAKVLELYREICARL